MTKRPKGATVTLGLRVKEPMRARIERAAKESGVSMNTAITALLESAFTREDTVDHLFGGPELRRMAILWAAAFEQGAHFGAHMQHGAPVDSLDKKELADPTTRTYREGALAVVESLMIGMPTETAVLFVESLKGRFMSKVINARRRAKGEA